MLRTTPHYIKRLLKFGEKPVEERGGWDNPKSFLSKEEIDYLTCEETLRQMAPYSLKQRTLAFGNKFQRKPISATKLS
jgi:hypothetical protein